MKVVRAPVPMKALPPSKSHVEEVVNKEGASENSVGGDSTSSAPEQELPVRYHNVLCKSSSAQSRVWILLFISSCYYFQQPLSIFLFVSVSLHLL